MVELKFNIQPWTKSVEDAVLSLAREWWAETKKPFDPDLNVLRHLYSTGALRIYTVSEYDKIVGYALATFAKHPFSGQRVFNVESIYIKPEFRKGLAGLHFIEFLINNAEVCGASEITISTSPIKDIRLLFDRLNFKKTTEIYGRSLWHRS